MNWLRKKIHRMAHYFGTNAGKVHTWWKGNEVWAAFWCDGCGEMVNAGPTGITADSSVEELARIGRSRESIGGAVPAAQPEQRVIADGIRITLVEVASGKASIPDSAKFRIDLVYAGMVIYQHRDVSVDVGDTVSSPLVVGFNS